jgi:hypothetical protein
MKLFLLISPFLFFVAFTVLIDTTHTVVPESEIQPAVVKDTFQLQEFPGIRDTLFTSTKTYIELILDKFSGVLHFRGDSTYDFKISTGNPRLLKGIKTAEGLFVIQYKSPREKSKQFHDAVMLHWMGFNYGIGMHGLLGRSYYASLGKSNRSHGCVRMTREAAEFVYSHVQVGTPVLVHSNNSAIAVAFTDSAGSYQELNNDALKFTVSKRLEDLYNGNYFLSEKDNLLITKNNITHRGVPIGNNKKINEKQRIPVIIQQPDVQGN